MEKEFSNVLKRDHERMLRLMAYCLAGSQTKSYSRLLLSVTDLYNGGGPVGAHGAEAGHFHQGDHRHFHKYCQRKTVVSMGRSSVVTGFRIN